MVVKGGTRKKDTNLLILKEIPLYLISPIKTFKGAIVRHVVRCRPPHPSSDFFYMSYINSSGKRVAISDKCHELQPLICHRLNRLCRLR